MNEAAVLYKRPRDKRALRSYQPAARESAVDSMSGVRFQGLAEGVRHTVGGEAEECAVAHSVRAMDPILLSCW